MYNKIYSKQHFQIFDLFFEYIVQHQRPYPARTPSTSEPQTISYARTGQKQRQQVQVECVTEREKSKDKDGLQNTTEHQHGLGFRRHGCYLPSTNQNNTK